MNWIKYRKIIFNYYFVMNDTLPWIVLFIHITLNVSFIWHKIPRTTYSLADWVFLMANQYDIRCLCRCDVFNITSNENIVMKWNFAWLFHFIIDTITHFVRKQISMQKELRHRLSRLNIAWNIYRNLLGTLLTCLRAVYSFLSRSFLWNLILIHDFHSNYLQIHDLNL